MAWSEPLFMSFQLAGVLAMRFYQIRRRGHLSSTDEVEKAMGMPPFVQARDGLIFLRY
jgi:hypothetical protein